MRNGTLGIRIKQFNNRIYLEHPPSTGVVSRKWSGTLGGWRMPYQRALRRQPSLPTSGDLSTPARPTNCIAIFYWTTTNSVTSPHHFRIKKDDREWEVGTIFFFFFFLTKSYALLSRGMIDWHFCEAVQFCILLVSWLIVPWTKLDWTNGRWELWGVVEL